MRATIFSPLAIICALSVLYPPSSHSEIEEVEWVDDALAEEEDLLSLFEEESDALVLDSEENSSDEPMASIEEVEELEEPIAVMEQEEAVEEEQPLNTPLFAQEEPPPTTPIPSSPLENNSFLSIGGSYAYVHLKPHGNSLFHGNLGGAQALYEYRPSSGFYGALKASWRQGETKASGMTRFLVDVDAEERIGVTFPFYQKKWLWTLFSGLGFRYINQYLKQSSADSIRFIYNEFYCPVGFKTLYEFSSCFSWGINGTWMPQVFPTVTISPLGGSRWKTTCSLSNALVEMPLIFFAGKNRQFSVSLVPHFEYWKDGHTTAETSTGEALGIPGNTYLFWGADLNLGYAF